MGDETTRGMSDDEFLRESSRYKALNSMIRDAGNAGIPWMFATERIAIKRRIKREIARRGEPFRDGDGFWTLTNDGLDAALVTRGMLGMAQGNVKWFQQIKENLS